MKSFSILLLLAGTLAIQLLGCGKKDAPSDAPLQVQEDARRKLFIQTTEAYYAPQKMQSKQKCKEQNSPNCNLIDAFYASRIETVRIGKDTFYKLEDDLCKHLGGVENIMKVYGVVAICPGETSNLQGKQ